MQVLGIKSRAQFLCRDRAKVSARDAISLGNLENVYI